MADSNIDTVDILLVITDTSREDDDAAAAEGATVGEVAGCTDGDGCTRDDGRVAGLGICDGEAAGKDCGLVQALVVVEQFEPMGHCQAKRD